MPAVDAGPAVMLTGFLEAVADGMWLWPLAAAGLPDSPAGRVREMDVAKFSGIFDDAVSSAVRWLCHGA